MKSQKLLKKFVLNLLVIFPATLLLLILIVNTTGRAGSDDATTAEALLVAAYHPDKQFNDYWYNNAAELARYELKQSRYGQMHDGEAVLIFVTEHLDPEKHVKTFNEDGRDIPVLKLNHARKFYTGLYPYSTMSSVFTPVNLKENPSTLRANFSGQDWCGHVWTMLDLKGSQYKGNVHSYFPDEGDYGVSLDQMLLEDEIFNRLRIDPASLPEGDISIVPSFMHLRLLHKEFRIYHAEAKHATASVPDGAAHATYEITYTDLDRKVIFNYEKDFPRQILGWEETYRSGFGESARELTTSAKLTNTLLLDYWSHNALADSVYRHELGLTQ